MTKTLLASSGKSAGWHPLNCASRLQIFTGDYIEFYSNDFIQNNIFNISSQDEVKD